MSKNEEEVRKVVRSLIQEELSPGEKSAVLDDLKIEVENVINSVLIDHGVHKKGLSDHQCAKLFREICKIADKTLDEFKTTRKPGQIENMEEYEKYMDLV